MRIVQEGAHQKFVAALQQVSYSGPYASQPGQTVLFVTELAVHTVAGRYQPKGWTDWTQGFEYGSALLSACTITVSTK